MSDDKSKTGPQDRSRVNVNERYELDYWTKRFGVTPELLKAAVAAVGPGVADVERQLARRG